MKKFSDLVKGDVIVCITTLRNNPSAQPQICTIRTYVRTLCYIGCFMINTTHSGRIMTFAISDENLENGIEKGGGYIILASPTDAEVDYAQTKLRWKICRDGNEAMRKTYRSQHSFEIFKNEIKTKFLKIFKWI